MGEIYYLPTPKELTQPQVVYWEQVLEDAERLRENALRMLGRLAVERGMEE